VAKDRDLLVGAVLCGHDGRRGYIHHLTIIKSHQGKGIAKAMVEKCMTSLKNEGIKKCHLFIFHKNQNGMSFWKKIGWTPRSDIKVMSKEI
jgi:ribosomal protein S18 acetylase RimI-like enzyme